MLKKPTDTGFRRLTLEEQDEWKKEHEHKIVVWMKEYIREHQEKDKEDK